MTANLITTPGDSAGRVRRLGAVALTLVSATVLAGCAGGSADAPAATPTAGGTLTVAIDADPVCLDPTQATLIASNVIGRQVVDSLIDQDPDTGEFVPWLAESWEVNDDATSFTFTLRDDATFSDGTPVDGEAVKASLDGIIALGAKSVYGASYLAGYEGTTVTDATTITVDFSAPNAQFLMAASTPTLGILSAEALATAPEERCAGTGLIGSGPFVLDSYTANQSVTIVKREGYDWPSELAEHDGEAYLDEVVYQVSTEPSVRAGSLASGQVDVATTIQSQDEPTFETEGFSLLTRVNPGIVIGISPNLGREGALQDADVRRAIQMGIDREDIATTVLTPSYGVATSPVGETTPGWTDLSDLLEYDAEGAAELLDEAGWTEGPDGIREKDGETLSLTVAYFYQTNVVEYLQQQLRKIGVDLVLEEMTAAQYATEYLTGNYDFISTSVSRPDPDILRAMFSSEGTNFTFSSADDPVMQELEPLFDTIRSTTDNETRFEAAAEAQTILVENGWIYPMSQLTQVIGLSDDVQGMRYDAASRFVLYDTTVSE